MLSVLCILPILKKFWKKQSWVKIREETPLFKPDKAVREIFLLTKTEQNSYLSGSAYLLLLKVDPV